MRQRKINPKILAEQDRYINARFAAELTGAIDELWYIMIPLSRDEWGCDIQRYEPAERERVVVHRHRFKDRDEAKKAIYAHQIMRRISGANVENDKIVWPRKN